jgi:hypothetical protein
MRSLIKSIALPTDEPMSGTVEGGANLEEVCPQWFAFEGCIFSLACLCYFFMLPAFQKVSIPTLP